jgi:hypothetical protein
MADTIKQVTDRLKGSTRVIIYSKGQREQAGLDELLQYADEVVPLPNIGREGETYLVSLMITIEVEPWRKELTNSVILLDTTKLVQQV